MGIQEQLIGLEDNADGRARVRGALVVAIEELGTAVADYAAAVEAATSAEIAYRQSDSYATVVEDHTRALLIPGIAGKNEAERTAFLRDRMHAHPSVAGVRVDRAAAQDDRDNAKARADVADVFQKAARAKVAALTALIAGV